MKLKLGILISFLLCTVLLFSACKQHHYDAEWIIGKTSAEIEEKYGKFDRKEWDYQEDGLLYGTDAGYIIKESRQSWYGKTTEELFVVRFNQEGIAISCEITPGNWGG